MSRKILRMVPIALVFFVALVLQSDARAQQPKLSPSPTGHAPLAIPLQPPPGRNPQDWARLRQYCQAMADKAAAHQSFSNSEFAGVGICNSAVFENSPEPNALTPPIFKGSAMPIPTPVVSPPRHIARDINSR